MKSPITRAQAIKAADKYAETVLREAVKGVTGLIDEAIDLRREKPVRFMLYHRFMKEWRMSQGYSGRFHLRWEKHYEFKARALKMEAIIEKCGVKCF